MRTLIIVLVLITLAAAAGLSFVLQAGAQDSGNAALEVSCTPQPVPANVDTLISCRFVARNNGPVPYPDARIDLVPASALPIPDRYLFFSASLDGVPFEVGTSQTSFALGEIGTREQRTLVLDVVVRSSRSSGAEAVLVDGSAGEVARAIISSDYSGGAPAVQLSATVTQSPDDPHVQRYLIAVSSDVERITYITAEVALPQGYSIPAEFLRPIFAAGPTPGRVPLTIAEIEPYLPPGDEEIFMFDVRADEGCFGGQMGIVFEMRNDAGSTFRPALIEDIPYVEACAAAAVSDGIGGASALPQGGFGPPAEHVEPALTLAAMLAGILGFATIGLAIFLVR